MKNSNPLFSIICLSACLCLIACSSDDDDNNLGGGEIEIPEDFDTNSQDIDIADAISIKFEANNTVTITNPYTEQVDITNEGGNVTITSTIANTELNYVLSGSINEGSIKIYSDTKFGLVFNGVSIISTSGPALNIQSSKKATVSIIADTNNRLVDGTTYPESEEDMKATIFSEGKLVFNGEGNLLVIGRSKHAICSDDYVKIDGGNIVVSYALKDGIHTNDYFEMTGGSLDITSVNDAIECEKGYINITKGTIALKSESGDGLKASYKGDDTSISPYISISGGTLDITIKGEASKGITAKNDINISGGEINIISSGDAYYNTDDADTSSSSGIKAGNNMNISGDCSIVINSSGKGGKGINVDGELTFDGGTTSVTTTGDQYVYDKNNDTASKAIKSDGNLTVNSGNITIKTTKTEAEGLESKATLKINGGNIEIDTYDDAINASDHIEITGGSIYCISTTNDAIDSNGTLTITGGTVVAVGAAQPEAGFDCDNSTFKITGGTIVGIGGSTSSPTSNVSSQRSLVYGKSGSYDLIHIESATGKGILTFKLPKTFSQTVLLFSSPSMEANTSYSIYTGGSISGGNEFHGLYAGAAYSKGTSQSTFTTASMVTTIGTTGGGGGGRP